MLGKMGYWSAAKTMRKERGQGEEIKDKTKDKKKKETKDKKAGMEKRKAALTLTM